MALVNNRKNVISALYSSSGDFCESRENQSRHFLHATFTKMRCLLTILAVILVFVDCQDPQLLLEVPLSPLGNLTLAGAGLALLEATTGPIALVGIAGPYRTGKSFLLNQLKAASDALQPPTIDVDGSTLLAVDPEGRASQPPSSSAPSGTNVIHDFPVGDTVWPVTSGLSLQYLGKSPDGTSVFAFGACTMNVCCAPCVVSTRACMMQTHDFSYRSQIHQA